MKNLKNKFLAIGIIAIIITSFLQPFLSLELLKTEDINVQASYCDNECAYYGQKRCSLDGKGVQTCGNYDSDSCLEWSGTENCGSGKYCEDGQCKITPPSCDNECAYYGQKRCSLDGKGVQTCGNYDSDSCLEWSGTENCGSGYTCNDGNCVLIPTCDNSCSSWSNWNDKGCGLRGCGDNKMLQERTRVCSISGCSTKEIRCVSHSSCQQDIDNPPIANAGPDKELYEGDSVVLQGSGYSPDGYSVSYSWSCNGGSLSNYHVSQPVYTAPSVSQNTTYSCSLTVRDSRGDYDVDDTKIYVLNKDDSCDNNCGSWSGWVDKGCGLGNCSNNKMLQERTRVCSISGCSTKETRCVSHSSCQQDIDNPPIANAGPDKELYEGDSVFLQGSGYSPDGYSVSYSWSCNGGSLSNYHVSQPVYTAPSVSQNTTYSCSLTVRDSRGDYTIDSMNVRVLNYSKGYTPDDEINMQSFVRNLSAGHNDWFYSVYANPNDNLMFKVTIQSNSQYDINNITVKHVLPSTIDYKGNLKIDNINISGNITSGIIIGRLEPWETKIITYEAQVAHPVYFRYGTTNLVNNVTAYNSNFYSNSTCEVDVVRGEVAGAATEVSTGLTDNLIKNSFLIPLFLSLILAWVFRSHIFNFEQWIDLRKAKYFDYHSKKELASTIAKIKNQETF